MLRSDSEPSKSGEASAIELPDFLPVTREEAAQRVWSELDVIIVTGDAYVDHPSFAPALLGRILEAKGFHVGILARPRPDHPEDFARLGVPRLFFAVSTGSVDSMLQNYTAQKRIRRDDAYAPGGKGGGRPDRALIVYCNMIRRAFSDPVAILGGGVEASLRRFAHFDFWDNAVRRPILMDAPADALVYGMGERPLIEIALGMKSHMARAGTNPRDALGSVARKVAGAMYRTDAAATAPEGYHQLPSFERVREDPAVQLAAFREEMEFRPRGVCQDAGSHRVIANPPPAPLSTDEMDNAYALRFRRQAHSSYTEKVPALEQVQFSVTSHRGCFGGCSFCGIFTHQGKAVQSRSRASVLHEVEQIVQHPEFRGTLRDIGGPTANMWGLSCKHGKGCTRPSCLAPKVCRYLNVDQKAYMDLLKSASRVPGVKHLFISSGVRMDLALRSEMFIDALAKNYTSGHAKVAPEHVVPAVLEIMMKPDGAAFLRFVERFRRASSREGKEQYVVPYFIAAHPGSRLEDMTEVALFLEREHMHVEQCQIFTPIPGTASAVMYATGVNPFTNQRIYVERDVRRRDMQKALVLYHLPENARLVREALRLCGRDDLVPLLLYRGGMHHSRLAVPRLASEADKSRKPRKQMRGAVEKPIPRPARRRTFRRDGRSAKSRPPGRGMRGRGRTR